MFRPQSIVAIIMALTVALFVFMSLWLDNDSADAKLTEWSKVLAVIIGALSAYINGGDKR